MTQSYDDLNAFSDWVEATGHLFAEELAEPRVEILLHHVMEAAVALTAVTDLRRNRMWASASAKEAAALSRRISGVLYLGMTQVFVDRSEFGLAEIRYVRKRLEGAVLHRKMIG